MTEAPRGLTADRLRDRIAADPARLASFERMLREDKQADLAKYCWAAARFFRGLDLEGKTILEVGSGRGLTSVFLGLQGAARVVSMEPGLKGSRPGVLSLQQQRVHALSLGHVVELLDADFNHWETAGERFDLVLSEASINHLYESPEHALSHRPTHDRYLQIWTKMRSLLQPDGVCCVSDACRHAFFAMTKNYGISRPWNPAKYTVNWRIHQNPGVWRTIALEAGFSRVEVEYPLPYDLKQFGSLVANPVTNFFLHGAFELRAFA